MLGGAKPVTSNNFSTLTGVAAKNTVTTTTSVKIATSNLFINLSDVPTYKSIEDLVLETLSSGEILDYGNTQAATTDNTGTGINSFQDNNNDLISNILYPNTDSENGVSSGETTTGGTTGGGVIIVSRNIEYYYPIFGNGTNGEFVYINNNNNLVIELVNIQGGEYVEVEFWRYETELNDTIYS